MTDDVSVLNQSLDLLRKALAQAGAKTKDKTPSNGTPSDVTRLAPFLQAAAQRQGIDPQTGELIAPPAEARH